MSTANASLSLEDHNSVEKLPIASGVFKGRRERHLPRAPFFAPPFRCYADKFSLFLMRNLLFTHIMCYKADHEQVGLLCFQKPPFRNCNVQVFCFQRAPQKPLKCVSTLLLNFIEGAPKRTCSV